MIERNAVAAECLQTRHHQECAAEHPVAVRWFVARRRQQKGLLMGFLDCSFTVIHQEVCCGNPG